MESATDLPYLLVNDPVAGRCVVRFSAGKKVTIGRAPTNDVVVHDDLASRCHAEIVPVAAGWAIRDLSSRNGTFVDDGRVSGERTLSPGDLISIGMARMLFDYGEPSGGGGAEAGTGSRSTGEMPAELLEWLASITHRRARGTLLEEIRESAAAVPQVGRAAAELCRLAFALGRAADMREAAGLAFASALEHCRARRGVVLLGPWSGDAATATDVVADALEPVASAPVPWPADTAVAGIAATVVETDEAVLAAGRGAEVASTISAPIRAAGRVIGVFHIEIPADERAATPDDLEFVMAVCDAIGVAAENLATREALSTKLASTTDENERLRRRLGEEFRIVGASAAMQAIFAQLERVAATKATVLVRGESGSGKELVARAIHDASDRRNGPCVCLNCAALSETLLESELFGHEKGAFTGATERKMGKFEAAHKGTLVLDEIGEMSPAIQAKFLRVLEGHPFERVGGHTRVQVDVRVVAATNRDLEEAVTAGEFRRDLYFRLKVVEILVPPLRQRPEDVDAIADHFLKRFAAETGRKVRGFTPAARAAMRSYRWPGNVRELRNCVERAVVLSHGPEIDVGDIVLSGLAAPDDSVQAALVQTAPPRPAFVPESIDEIERRHVLATLEAVGGNKTKAAAILGIERSTLDRKLARWAARADAPAQSPK